MSFTEQLSIPDFILELRFLAILVPGDSCFESLEVACIRPTSLAEVITSKWTFNARLNKCVPIKVTAACPSKNLFHNENACRAVCPHLSQCERLKIKNTLAAKRSAGQNSISWFDPQCDAETGNWLPVQCLSAGEGGAMSGVCWCADKKGAPQKGSLTRNIAPVCNSRQARRRLQDDDLQDPVMEELIRQMTIMVDDNLIDEQLEDSLLQESLFNNEAMARHANLHEDITDRMMEMSTPVSWPKQTAATATAAAVATAANQIKVENKSTRKLVASSTRCLTLKLSAPFPVACDAYGSFMPTQCNGEMCWCVDAAGNQLPTSTTFAAADAQTKCRFTPIDVVSVELHMKNPSKRMFPQIYDIVEEELTELLRETPANLVVDESPDHIVIKFDMMNANKIDEAFALEEMVRHESLVLVNGQLRPDITLSRFLHQNGGLNGGQTRSQETLFFGQAKQQTSAITENTFQTIVFILATGSAFLISVFVIFVMLKRGRANNKHKNLSANKFMGMGDKNLDYTSPIFVLSAKDNMSLPPQGDHQHEQQHQEQLEQQQQAQKHQRH